MSVGIQTDPIEGNERLWSRGLDAYPTTFGEAQGAIWDDAWARNPTPSIGRAMDRQGYYPSTDEFGIEQAPRKDATILDAKRANEEYGIPGELSFGQDVPEPIAEELHRLKRDELQRKDVLNRSPGGFVQGATSLLTGFGASALDPINIASAFIPVVGPARYGIWVAERGPTVARLAKGGIEGAVGSALVEPVVYGVARSEQADYHATDSLLNIAFGTALGGGLHAGLGKIGDLIERRHAQEPALRSAVAALTEGRPVDVEALLRTDPEIARALDLSRRDLMGGTALGRTMTDQPVSGFRISDARPEPVEAPTVREPEVIKPLLDESRARLADLEIELRKNPNPKIREGVLAKIDAERAVIAELRNELNDLAETGAVDTMDSAAPRRENKGKAERQPVSLSQALAAEGGLRDDGGELKAMDARKQVVGLVSAKGRALDDAAMWAWENGYFPGHTERPSINDLLNAVRDDLSGKKRYTVNDAADLADRRDAEANSEALHEAATEMGIPIRKNMTDAEIMAQIRDHELFYEALERAAIRAESMPEVQAERFNDGQRSQDALATEADSAGVPGIGGQDRAGFGEQSADASRAPEGTAESSGVDLRADRAAVAEALRQAAERASKPKLDLADALAAAEVERIAERAAKTGDDPTAIAVKEIEDDLLGLTARIDALSPEARSAIDAAEQLVKDAENRARAIEAISVCETGKVA